MRPAGEDLGEMMTGYQAHIQTGEEHGLQTEYQDRLARANSFKGEGKVIREMFSKDTTQPTHFESRLKERSNNIKDVCEENKAELLWQPDNFQMKLKNHI